MAGGSWRGPSVRVKGSNKMSPRRGDLWALMGRSEAGDGEESYGSETGVG